MTKIWTISLAVAALVSTGCSCEQKPGATKSERPAVVLVDPEEETRIPTTPEKEQNDQLKLAQELKGGEWIEALMGEKDQDWFRMTITTGGQVARVQVHGVTGLDLRLEAFKAQDQRLVTVNNSKAGGGEVLVNLSVEPGFYFLRVSEVKGRGAAVPYRVGFTLGKREEGEEVEPNWKAALATPLGADQEAVGYLGWHTDTDWYRVDTAGISSMARLRVELDGVDGVRARLSIRDAANKVLAQRSTSRGKGALVANLAPPAAGDGHFHVVVSCRKDANVETRYFLRVMSEVPPGPTELEPNDKIVQATPLTPGKVVAGLLADRKDRDIYHIPAQEEMWLALTVRPPMGVDLKLELLDDQGKPVWTINGAGVRLPEVMPALMIRPPGAWVQVRAVTLDQVGGNAPYVLSAKLLAQGGLEREPNDKAAQASAPWPADQWPIQGYIHPGDDVDHYRISAASDRLRISLKPSAGLALRGVLLDWAGARIAEVEAEPGTSGSEAEAMLEVDVTSGREYLLRVSDPRGKGDGQQGYTIQRENP